MAMNTSEKFGAFLSLVSGVIGVYLTYVGTHSYLFRSGPGFPDTLLTYGDSSVFEIGLMLIVPFFALGLWLARAYLRLMSKFVLVLATAIFCITTWNFVSAPVVPPSDVGLDAQICPASSVNYLIGYILTAICLIIGAFGNMNSRRQP
jgi:hypothetical protein